MRAYKSIILLKIEPMRIFLVLVIIILLEFYSYIFVQNLTKNKIVHWAYIIINFGAVLYFTYFLLNLDRSKGQNHNTMFIMGILLLMIIPKLIITLLLGFQDIMRLLIGTFNKIIQNTTTTFLPDRRKFVSQIAFGMAVIPFLSILYGITKGKYNFKTLKQKIFFDDLPDAFDGFRILQLSDLHVGSWDNEEKIKYGIDLINQQEVDLIVFTGDLVNSLVNEADPWLDVLKRIKKAPYGNYSVLGNHDYGEYVRFDTEAEKAANFEAIKGTHPKIGFQLLLNEHVFLNKDGEKIALVGVENWGLNFKKAGDLALAGQGLNPDDFKVLLSHDPSHWDAEVVNNPQKYQLTLSGHTHGMQFGIEIPGWFKWSPVKYIYKQWAGLYQKGKQYIYVNRGFGFHAYSGRVGIMPEITILELKKLV